MSAQQRESLVRIDESSPIWSRFFNVAPLVLVGTKEAEGGYDLAPKHMATPLGWENYFGFVCTPEHRTYRNARRESAFTVSYPRPEQIVLTSLAAAPRCSDDSKPALSALPTVPASEIDGVLIRDAYAHLECRVHAVFDDFGANSLVAGHIVAAHVHPGALRGADRDDADLLSEFPLLAYLDPGRYAPIGESFSFPFSRDLGE